MSRVVATALLTLLLGSAHALPLVGESKLTVLFWDIYTARLYAPQGRFAGIQPPLTLTLTYHRTIEAEALLEATREQWQRLGFTDSDSERWLAQAEDCFPNVARGDTVSFELGNGGDAIINHNGTHRCHLPATRGNRRFLAIWLSERSAYPRFTRELIAAGE